MYKVSGASRCFQICARFNFPLVLIQLFFHPAPLQVTVQNPENQGYLIAYKDSQLIVSSARWAAAAAAASAAAVLSGEPTMFPQLYF